MLNDYEFKNKIISDKNYDYHNYNHMNFHADNFQSREETYKYNIKKHV